MASSLRKQIIDNVVQVIGEDVLVSAGYNNDLSKEQVSHNMKQWDDCPTYPYICVIGGNEEKDHGEETLMHAWMELVVYLFEHDAIDGQEKIEKLIQDVEKIMYVDHSRGDIAVDTKMKRVSTDNGWLNPHVIAEVVFEIHYRYFYGSP